MESHSRSWFRRTEDGLELLVRLTPRAARDAMEGMGETPDGQPHLKARVRAVPEGGKANRALETLLAKTLGIARGDVTVVAGASARLKTVAIACDVEAVAPLLDMLAGRGPGA